MGGQGPGQGLEQHRVQPGKERGVGADADGQGQDGEDREGRVSGRVRKAKRRSCRRPSMGAGSFKPRATPAGRGKCRFCLEIRGGAGARAALAPGAGCGTSRSHVQNR